MTIEAGSNLGPYEILNPLGAGGMGEVYLARDNRLDRTVAIKVLPDHLSASPEIQQRFEREAKVISSLSHPHICTLFDVGHEEGMAYLVMEHLEGESLAERLERGAVPLPQVMEIGVQIADALDKAHKSGVIHRDLKPGNIMLTASGVKLLDFGLAKHYTPEAEVSGADFSRLLTETPASAPLTVEGTILGTFQYMSPEQIEGKEADARSDIFALGAMLYEMASGRKPFIGKTQASLIGAIMHSEPESVSMIAPMAPPAFDRVVQTCLAKDPEERWHTAHDLKLQLQWIAEGGSQVGVPVPIAARRKSRERLAWAVAAGLALVAGVFALGFLQRAPEPREVVRFEIPQPEGLPVVDSPKVSPDGRYIAYNATDEQGRTMIWLRPLNALDAQPMPGTEDAMRPFWSPDSKFLGFMAEGKLKKIPVSGGPAQVICDAPTGADGSWSEKGQIFYDGTGGDPIMQVAGSGGIPTELVTSGNPESADLNVGWPQFLPGGERFLYVDYQGEGGAEIRFAKVDGSEEKTVLKGQSRVEYAPPGYLLYVREATLVAQPFDAKNGELTGEPVPIAEDLSIDNVGLAHFSASRNGVLALRGGEAGGGQLVWVDKKGESRELIGDPGDISVTSLSPDGRWLAMVVTASSSENADIWVRDLTRGVTSRLTFNEASDQTPLWSPDGDQVAYAAGREEGFDLAITTVGGSGQVEFLLERERDQHPSSFSADGKYLLFYDRGEETNWDIWVLPLEGDQEPFPFLMTPFVEVRARFSPSGQWVAYQTNESGRSEIYVQAFPGPGGKWQISTAGGTEPQWSPDGRKLYYISPEMNMMQVDVETGDSFDAGIPEEMFSLRLRQITNNNRYLVSPDGERFLLLSSLQGDSTPPTTVVLNWDAALTQ